MKKIILISAKAQHGKDTFALLSKEYLESKGERVLVCHYADLLKYICANFFEWNGAKNDVGRKILQHVGTDVIRNRENRPDYWVDFIIDILEMFGDEWDYVLIPDTRFPNEIYKMSGSFDDVEKNTVHCVRIVRDNFDSGLSKEQLSHPSECALDDFDFDYYVYNNSSLENLRQKVKFVVDEIEKM